jgi:hypothetical protein
MKLIKQPHFVLKAVADIDVLIALYFLAFFNWYAQEYLYGTIIINFGLLIQVNFIKNVYKHRLVDNHRLIH